VSGHSVARVQGDRIAISRDGAVGIVSFGSEVDADTFPSDLCGPLRDALRELNADATCRCIVLALDRGGALDVAPTSPPPAAEVGDIVGQRACAQQVTAVFRDLMRGPKPIVGAAEGRSESAGLALMAACDHVVAAQDVRFRCAALARGLLPDLGLLWNLPRKIGAGRARELMLLGRDVDAREAQRLGLVNELAASGQALAGAVSAARRYEALPLVALALLRAALVNGTRSLEAGVREELDLNPLVREAADHAGAIAAFRDKRQPNFTGN
jgi:enoyl-CoA hydratase/carnithine racemase